MSFLQQLWNERHFDWAPVLAIVHGPTSTALVESLNGGLATIGWPTPYPDREQWAMIVGVSVGTLLLYFLFFEMRNRCVARGAGAREGEGRGVGLARLSGPLRRLTAAAAAAACAGRGASGSSRS